MEYGKEINKEEFDKWITALRSGEYSQQKHRLQGKNGFCCLGVACHVIMDSPNKGQDGFIVGAWPNTASSGPSTPEWLMKINTDFYDLTQFRSLSILNDSEDMTFDEIADLLELVYIHKALD